MVMRWKLAIYSIGWWGKDQDLIIYGYISKYGLLFLSYTYF